MAGDHGSEITEQNLTGRTLGAYEVGRRIGKGGGGTVYRARSTVAGPAGDAGTSIALKVFHPELITDERIFQRFQREAELGIRIRHPYVVPTFEIGSHEIDGTPYHYMAMEFVEGEVLRDTLTELKTLPEHLLYQVADQVLDALAAVHAEGMIHRDVKPENIVLTQDQQVRVMDLGVARLQQEGRDLTRAGEFVGSLAYAAPEQFMDQDHVDPRADLYSIGVLLYEAATGWNPFDAADLSTLITEKLKGQVRRPKSINRDLDPFLDEVILTCIHVQPDERFQSCDELRTVLKEGARGRWWTDRIQGEAFPAATRALQRLRPPRDAPLVGREKELERLHRAFEGARAAEYSLTLVGGAAGVGKSRLVHDFLEELVAPDGPLLWAGRCPEEAGQGCHAFLEAAGDFFNDRAAMERRLAELGQDARLAGQVFHGEGGKPSADDLASTLGALLRALAAERPLILIVEDLHRADPESMALLDQLARSLADSAVFLLGTYRPDEVEEGSALHTLAAAGSNRLDVEPLERDAADEVIAALVGNPRTVRALSWPLFSASDGNPYFLIEIVTRLKETGALVESDEGWTATLPISEVALPPNVHALLALKLVGLDEELMGTLEAAAIQGPEFDASPLATVTGQKRIRLLKRLALLERKHRLLVSSGKSSFRFATHALQQVVYAGVPETRRAQLHSQYADAIRGEAEELSGDRAHAWVRHLLRAERLFEAGEHVAAAIEHAATHYHSAAGVVFLEQLVAALAPESAHLRFDALMHLAGLQRLLGRRDEQVRALERAAAEAERIAEPGQRGRLLAAFADASWAAGDYEQAEAEAARGLELANEAGDRACKAQCLHTLGGVAYRRGDFPRCAECWREALDLRRAVGDRRGEAASLIRLGAVMPEIGEEDRALETKQEGLEILREIGDRRGEGGALNNMGNALVDAERIDEALVCYEQSVKIARELGDLPAQAAALYNRARVLTIVARIEEAKDAFEEALDIYREIGDPNGEASVLDELGSAVATFGDLEQAIACLDDARAAAERNGEKTLLARVLRHLGTVHHETGAREMAWKAYERALDLAPARARAAILGDMGRAAEREGDPERATTLLEASVSDARGDTQLLLSLCRLARVHRAAGRHAEAVQCARRAEGLIGDAPVAQQYGPEVYYSLGTVLADSDHGRAYVEMANKLLGARTRSIRSVVYRQHYLTTRWPNREILEEARRLVDSA